MLKKAIKLVSALDPNYVEELLQRVTKILSKESRLALLPKNPLLFIGDTHGDLEATQGFLSRFWESPTTFVFLGDYVDRGPKQIENINLLYELKTQAPDRIILLRGNHEIPSINRRYGFASEISLKLPNMMEAYSRSFAELPLAAASSNYGIFAVHGGIAEELDTIDIIENLEFYLDPDNTFNGNEDILQINDNVVEGELPEEKYFDNAYLVIRGSSKTIRINTIELSWSQPSLIGESGVKEVKDELLPERRNRFKESYIFK